MGLVTDILVTLDSSVKATGAQYFERTAQAIGPTVTVAVTLLIVLVGLNMSLGIWRLTTRDSVQLITRIVLVWLIGQSWTNFNTIYDAFSNGLSDLAISFFDVAKPGGSGGSRPGFEAAAAMDGVSSKMADVTDGAAKAVSSIVRGFFAALLLVALGLLMAAYIVIVGFAKIMIAFLIGIAPLAIAATIFQKTKNLFEAWLSSLIGYMMYPIAAAGVVGVVVKMADSQFQPQTEVSSISMLLGFCVVIIVGIYSLLNISTAASNITGQFNLASVAPQAITAVGKPFSMAGRGATDRLRSFYSGARHGVSPNLAARRTERAWSESGSAFREKMRQIDIMRPKGPKP